jgi:hypothetical protein
MTTIQTALTISETDIEPIPDTWVAPPELAAQAYAAVRELISLGQDISDLRSKQRCWAAGHGNVISLAQDPEIGEALWGAPLDGPASAARLVRLVKLQLMFQPTEPVDVFSLLPKSVTSTGILVHIENEAKKLPAPESPERADAVQALVTSMTTIGQRPWRENREAAKAIVRAEKPFQLDSRHGILTYANGHGPKPVLRIDPQAGALAATAVHRLTATAIESWSLSENALTAWVDGQPHKVAQVLTDDDHVLNAIADALRATRK